MNTNVSDKIMRLFEEKEIFQGIGKEEDFFERGVSSLTVVGLQISIEKELDVSVSTSELMKSPTISQWVRIYTDKVINV